MIENEFEFEDNHATPHASGLSTEHLHNARHRSERPLIEDEQEHEDEQDHPPPNPQTQRHRSDRSL